MSDARRISIGVVSYLNARPLVRPLLSGSLGRVEELPPSEVASGLAAGRLDLGLVPVIEFLRQPTLRRISNAGIAADGPVWTVLLLLKTAPHRIRRLCLDPNSRTSQILALICLEHLYGVRPEVYERSPLAPPESEDADAVLVIGDAAVPFQRGGYPHLDLSRAWRTHFGLPFVFAVWGATPGVNSVELETRLEALRDEGVRDLEACVAEAALAGIEAEWARVYLSRRIRYRLDEGELLGLGRYLELARPLSSFVPCAQATLHARPSLHPRES